MPGLESPLLFRDGIDVARHRAWFAKNLQRLLDDRKVRPRVLANAIGANESDVSRWRRGAIPEDDTMEAIATYFDVEVADLIRNPDGKARTLKDASMIDLIEELALRVGKRV